MDIEILHFAKGAAAAKGLTVVIDVFRAFSVACYAFDRGVSAITATTSIEYAREYKRRHPDAVLVGERHAKKIEGFDFGNSPSEIMKADLSAKPMIHTTHAGTRALVAAVNADDVITGSFVNLGAVIRHIRAARPSALSLVCAGFEGKRQATEDMLCAEYIRDALVDRPPSMDAIRNTLMGAPSARRFFDENDPHSPEVDFHLCLALDRFDFLIRRIRRDQNGCLLQRTDG